MFCTHGVEQSDLPPCSICRLRADFHYCGHGFDGWTATSDLRPRCAFCRGVTRRLRNSAVPGFSVGPRTTYRRPPDD